MEVLSGECGVVVVSGECCVALSGVSGEWRVESVEQYCC